MYLDKEDPLKKAQRHSMRGKWQKDLKEEAGVSFAKHLQQPIMSSKEKTGVHSRKEANDAKVRKSVPGPKSKCKSVLKHKFQRRPLKAKTKHQIYLKYLGIKGHA